MDPGNQKPPEMGFSMSCKDPVDETLDEDTQRACMLLARFMRDHGILKSGSFDWTTSEFRFSGITGIPQYHEVSEWLDQERIKKLKQLISVLLFAEDKGCRNEFLQAYFSGSDSKRKCSYCDRCGYDLDSHLAYIQGIQETAGRQ